METPPSGDSTPPARLIPSHVRAGLDGGYRESSISPTASSAFNGRQNDTQPQLQYRQTRSTPSLQRPHRPPSMRRPHKASLSPFELRISVMKIPKSWRVRDLVQFFGEFGDIARVQIEGRGALSTTAMITFRPAPVDISWVGGIVSGSGSDGIPQKLETRDKNFQLDMMRSVNDPKKFYPERISIPLITVDFGMMQELGTMQVLRSSKASATQQPQLMLDLYAKAILIYFVIELPASSDTANQGGVAQRYFKTRISLTQFRHVDAVRHEDESTSLVFSIDSPPEVYRKLQNIKATQEGDATLWDERQTWYRQTNIDCNPHARTTPVQLRTQDCVVDIGRWLTYRLRLNRSTRASLDFENIFQALTDHNVCIQTNRDISFHHDFYDKPSALWTWLGDLADNGVAPQSSVDVLKQMANGSVYLPFLLRYHLEVCLSSGVLRECNIDRNFMEQLALSDSDRAVKILEKIADAKERYYEPHNIFRLTDQVSIFQKKRPSYCTKIGSATITPSTIYIMTPVLETSNRVIRQFQQFEDRFLRVKFTDERHRGKIAASDDRLMDEVYSRISQALTYGIIIGDRHYEFLAFGNSQFREHGAYFFASTNSMTAAKIRQWMGNFTDIKVVAKYCSRIGQCFTTTRAIPHTVSIKRIPDVKRNGFVFTDGVGKISPFLAYLVANHYGLASSEESCPSVFQFRMAGCKGVLAVDPALKGMTVQIRPSQEKFPAYYHGLEICRMSQFSAANLNMQLILVLSSLGVPDEVFVLKLRCMLTDLTMAMTNKDKACELLQKNVDYNQMTLGLASMLYDFMDTREPFVLTCLRLWRSWNLKYLKEKARIFVDQGAFLMGTIDESGILRGHSNDRENQPGESREDGLAEIFLQIPDAANQGRYRVVTGICALARNPSLHPGDVRVVRAVDIPALHHHRDCVVLPQTGDRDLANMCSGGDLDGDDYIVMWDPELMPREWNHDPMDYTADDPVVSKGPVTVKDMANFFVKHIKHDNLGRIAVAHRYWADSPMVVDGIKDAKCLKLAELHSKAVDYAKTGVPAEMGEELKVTQWPHWSQRSRGKTYHSKKVLGKLYDEVTHEMFEGAWDLPFNQRILQAHVPTTEQLHAAKTVKGLYDEAVRRIMTQYGIKSEFEVMTTFVLEHHQDINDYKFAEFMGETTSTLRQQYREMCYEAAGTNCRDREQAKIMPFLVAMYIVTADEVTVALAETERLVTRGGRAVPTKVKSFDTMPFISFPWLFARELGEIANPKSKNRRLEMMPGAVLPVKAKPSAATRPSELLSEAFMPPALPEINTAEGVLHEGDLLDLYHDERRPPHLDGRAVPQHPDTLASISPPPVDKKFMEVNVSEQMINLYTTQECLLESPTDLSSESYGSPANLERLKSLYDAAGLPTDKVIQEKSPVAATSPPQLCLLPLQAAGPQDLITETMTPAAEKTAEWDSESESEETVVVCEREPSIFDKIARFGGTSE